MAKFPASKMLGYRQSTEAVTRVVVVSRSETQNKNLIFAYWGIFHAFWPSADFFQNRLFLFLKIISEIQNERPDLGPNCLQRLSAMTPVG